MHQRSSSMYFASHLRSAPRMIINIVLPGVFSDLVGLRVAIISVAVWKPCLPDDKPGPSFKTFHFA